MKLTKEFRELHWPPLEVEAMAYLERSGHETWNDLVASLGLSPVRDGVSRAVGETTHHENWLPYEGRHIGVGHAHGYYGCARALLVVEALDRDPRPVPEELRALVATALAAGHVWRVG